MEGISMTDQPFPTAPEPAPPAAAPAPTFDPALAAQVTPPAGGPAAPAPAGASDVTQPVPWAPEAPAAEMSEPRVAAAPPSTAPAQATPPPAWTAAPPPAAWAPPPQQSAPAPRARRSVGPGLVVGAVLATALLTSGGTYLAVTAANGGAPAPSAPTGVQTGSQATPTPAPATQATPAPVANNGSVVDIVKAVSPAVVTIVAETSQGTGTGSGVIFDANGLILTNHHVVAGDPSKLTVKLKDGRTLDASIYGIDTLTDLAIVKVNETGLPTAAIGDSSTIQVGQQAIAIGSPLGEFTDSVTTGIISALGRSIDVQDGSTLTNLIQTDTAINPGNSGGPLLDGSGKVVGINTAIAGNAEGIGFAIPINIARPLLAQASAGQPLARAWLGIRFETIDPQIKAEANLPVDNGAWIPSAAALTQGNGGTNPAPSQDPNGQGINPLDPFGQGQSGQAVPQDPIVAGSPAEKAGLAAGDIITAVDGTTLDAAHPLDMVVSQLAPGQNADLDVLRNGQTLKITVTLGTRPANL
jgi:S1-C subfamily serine protease